MTRHRLGLWLSLAVACSGAATELEEEQQPQPAVCRPACRLGYECTRTWTGPVCARPTMQVADSSRGEGLTWGE